MPSNINGERLLKNLKGLGEKGIIDGKRSRLASSEQDKEGRDFVKGLMEDAGLRVEIDKVGNIFGIWETDDNKDQKPIMMGSHIDSVEDAGIYDGCTGVIGGIEVIQTLKEAGYDSPRPLVVGAFSNEEGARYQPDMFGSLVYVGGLDVEEALNTEGIDGTIYGEELEKIGYKGDKDPMFIEPEYFVEYHVEQGPVLDREGYSIGVVDAVQGISWQEVTIEGEANHGGTTPTSYRKDAGLAAAKIITYLRERTSQSDTTVAMAGMMKFEPNLVNVIPSKAVFTIDLRDPNNDTLKDEERRLQELYKKIEKSDDVKITSEQLVRFDPVPFDEEVIEVIEKAAKDRDFSYRRITSGAGHDAQMLARVAKTAMIFVPSIEGISHNPGEATDDQDIINGGNVLLDTLKELAHR